MMIRLNEDDIVSIKNAFTSTFDSSDELWVFGSRVDPNRKGGDIDLYIKTREHDLDEIMKLKISFHLKLDSFLGERKIDIIINAGTQHLDIYDIAETTGVRLV